MSIVPSDVAITQNITSDIGVINQDLAQSNLAQCKPIVTAIVQKSDDPDDVLEVYSEAVDDQRLKALQKLRAQ